MASGKAACGCEMTPTSLYFQISDRQIVTLTPQIFLEYLEQNLKLRKRKVKIKLCSYKTDKRRGCIEAEVQFPSVNKAKKSRRLICEADGSIVVSLSGFKTHDVVAMIERSCKSIEEKKRLYLQYHKEKIIAIAKKIREKQKKFDFSLLQKQLEEINALEAMKEELENQSHEFISYSKKLLQDFERLKMSVYTSRKPIKKQIFAIQAEFARDCVHFQKALPIYAKRTNIIKCISNSQVCVVIGETGSGKSTQLVQYLYDAGFAKDRIIACTQPRKVAATSLAEHVSSEMCCTQGSLVSSKVSATKQVKENTKILYLTDHALLNECIQDCTFSKYSCLIIDEAHERSLHTDILLAFIKQCLPLRPDLKVIITSATIDPQLFVNYFGECPVLKVSGRTFPVDVIWCPLTKEVDKLRYQDCPYVEEAVECAKNIHCKEPTGAILVFLTSVFEIELACTLAENTFINGDVPVIVLPLHGRLQPADQKKVFQTYSKKRKIIFSTNVAETSITIPDVKYIIDSGYSKEMCFDARRNMNSLEVRRISKSSAEQRKGRAGRVSAGKCYRLFSEEVFKTMPDRGLPEILRVHLTHAVLKIFHFGVTDIINFDFVEKPNCASLKTAVEMLVFLGAIDKCAGNLTETGRRLSLLPIDPQLGKILFDAINENLFVEAAISVAVSSLGGNIFFRGQTLEMKAESDQQKIKFVHPGGDQLTALNVFKEWIALKKGNRNKWCVENCINAKSMRLVEETVTELTHIVTSQFQVQCPLTKVPNLKAAEEKLVKLYFLSFLWNTAIYLGHEKAGYMTPQIVGEQLLIFPGSSLVQYNVVPKYVFYEKTLKTSQQYMVQVSIVDESWIKEAVACGNISKQQLKKIEECKVKETVITNIGTELLGKVLKHKRQLEDDLRSVSQNSPFALDWSHEKGTISIFSSSLHQQDIKKEVIKRLNTNREEMKKQTRETGVTEPKDDVKLVLGKGGCIQYIMMPLDFDTLIVKGPVESGDEWTKCVQQLFKKSKKIVKKEFAKEIKIYATFSNPKDADEALKSDKSLLPEGVSFLPQTMRGKGEGRKLFKLQIDWERRKKKDFCFVWFRNQQDFDSASDKLLSLYSQLKVGRFFLKIEPAKNPPPNSYQLFIARVHGLITLEQIKQAISERVLHDNFTVQFGHEKSFPTTPEQVQALTKQLHQIISNYATKGQFKVFVQQPEDHHITFRSYVEFNDPDEGHEAMNNLESDSIGEVPLKVKLRLSSLTRIPNCVYEVLEADLIMVKRKMQDVDVVMKVKKSQANCNIELSSGDLSALANANKDVNAILQPCEVDCGTGFLQQYMQSGEFREELDKIQIATQTVIFQNFRAMSLEIYGKKGNCEEAKTVFTQKLQEVEVSGLYLHEIQLRDPEMPPGLMRYIIQSYGVNLQGICSISGIRRATIDPRKQVLSLLSDKEGLLSIQEMIDEYRSTISIQSTSCNNSEETSHNIFECCVCLTEIEDKNHMYILECCGHSYHLECIEMQLASSNVSFPIICAASNCSCPFVWLDFDTLCKKRKLSLYALVECSLKAYLTANKDKVRNCLTPDCKMIYAVSEREGRRFICSKCGTHICTKCHVQYHDGLSCTMYSGGHHEEEEVQEWIGKDPSKRKCCPCCKAPIEKIAGCNKLTCTQCQSNICWVCLQYFQTEDKCYKHLRKYHGGFE